MNKKRIVINNKETHYFITDTGQLYNSKTKNWYKGTVAGGYLRYDLSYENKRYSKLAHRLVAEAFIENPNNLPIVNHKDGNKLNNNINNLEWVTYKENLIHAYNNGLKEKTNGMSNRIQDTNNTLEDWKQYKDTTYVISKNGKIKNLKTNNILKGKITKDGYVEWCLILNNKKCSKLAHRMVYETYKGKLDENLVINHLDGDKTNNHIDNLEQITRSENVKHAYYITHKQFLRQVAKMDLEGNILEVYESCADAARKNVGCYSNLISNVCNGKTQTHKGFKWKYLEKE